MLLLRTTSTPQNLDRSSQLPRLTLEMNKNQHSATTLYQEMCLSSDQGRTRLQALRVGNKQKKQFQNTIRTDMEGEAGELRKMCLIDDWMEKKRLNIQRVDNDIQFYSASSSSSQSSSPGFSSSDCESVLPRRNKDSCFYPMKQKHIRTSTLHSRISKNDRSHLYGSVAAHREKPLRSDSKALKMYADLKNSKLPISPGGKLTRFINSVFNGRRGETKAANLSSKGSADDFKHKCQMSYTCSSASSSTRSCLIKKSPSPSTDKSVKKSVRFYPANVEYSVEIRSRNEEHSPSSIYTRKDENLRFSLTDYYRGTSELVDENDTDDDAASDTSSELFEIDHIIFGAVCSKSSKHHENELPVFETTNIYGINQAISSSEIC